MVLFIFYLGFMRKTGGFSLYRGNVVRWNVLIQFSLMSLTGIGIIWLAVADLYKCRDSKSLLLLLWVLGTFFFAGFVNWTVNERSILPMAPAVGILLARAIDRQGKTGRQIKGWQVSWPLIPATIVALSVCWADYTLAGTAREAAKTIHETYKNQPVVLWFQGHWGFQYYMQAHDGRALDFISSRPVTGDIMVMPTNNTNVKPLSADSISPGRFFVFTPCRWLSTMCPSLGASFYTDVLGPLPFAFGRVPAEKYDVFVVR
jgi:hypothetical protein